MTKYRLLFAGVALGAAAVLLFQVMSLGPSAGRVFALVPLAVTAASLLGVGDASGGSGASRPHDEQAGRTRNRIVERLGDDWWKG